MDIAMAKNNANISGSTFECRPRDSGIANAAVKAIENGKTILVIPTLQPILLCFQTVDKSTSIPATSKKSTIARVAMASRAMAFTPSRGKRMLLSSGARLPMIVGPNRTPASSSPSTAGCFNHWAISPKRRTTQSRTLKERKSTVMLSDVNKSIFSLSRNSYGDLCRDGALSPIYLRKVERESNLIKVFQSIKNSDLSKGY